jgi:hypothetical protein
MFGPIPPNRRIPDGAVGTRPIALAFQAAFSESAAVLDFAQ